MTIHWILRYTFDHKRLAIDLSDGWPAAQLTLSYTKNILSHGVRSLERILFQAVCSKFLVKRPVTFRTHRLGAINHRAPGRQVHAFEVTVTDLLGAKVISEIREP